MANSRSIRVDNIADHLVRKFGAPGSRNFFCKCAWKLSEDDIWSAYEQAHLPNKNGREIKLLPHHKYQLRGGEEKNNENIRGVF